MFAKFSPDATRVAYVRANNIYVERLDDGARHAADDRRIGDDHQRHVRLGLRGGARRPRRLPLEPGRHAHRLLAVRHDRRRHLLADQRHRHALSRHHAASRIRRPAPPTPRCASAWSTARRRRHALDEDARRSARHLPGAPRVGRCAHAGDPAAQSAAEPERLPARRRAERRRARACSATSRRPGSRSSTRCGGSTTAARSCGSASATAGSTSIACRARAASRSWSRASTPTSSMSPAWTKRAAGCTSSRRPENATQRYLYRSQLDGTGTPERVTPGIAAGHAQLRPRARRPARVPHLLALRSAAGDRRRRAAGASRRCARSPTRRRSTAKLAPVLKPPVEFFTVDIGDGVIARRLDAEAVDVRRRRAAIR